MADSLGRAVLRFTPELLVGMLKAGGLPRRFEIIEHALPPDAELLSVGYDGRDILLELTSATFIERDPLAPGVIYYALPLPVCRLVESDVQVVHDACRLRAALVAAVEALTLEYGSETAANDCADLLTETARYVVPPFALKGSADG